MDVQNIIYFCMFTYEKSSDERNIIYIYMYRQYANERMHMNFALIDFTSRHLTVLTNAGRSITVTSRILQ